MGRHNKPTQLLHKSVSTFHTSPVAKIAHIGMLMYFYC